MIFKVVLKNKYDSLAEQELTALKGFLISELRLDISNAQKIIQDNLPIYSSEIQIDNEIILNKLKKVGLDAEILKSEEEPQEIVNSFLSSEQQTNQTEKSEDKVSEPATTNEPKKEKTKEPIIGLSRTNYKTPKDEVDFSSFKKNEEIHEDIQVENTKPDKKSRLQNLLILLIISTILGILNYFLLPKKQYEEVKILSSEIDTNTHVLKTENNPSLLYSAEVHVLNLFLKNFIFTFSTPEPPMLTPEELIVAKVYTPWIKSGVVTPAELTTNASKEHYFKGNVKVTFGYGPGEQKQVTLADINLKLDNVKSGSGDILICYRCSELPENKDISLLSDGEIAFKYQKTFTYKE